MGSRDGKLRVWQMAEMYPPGFGGGAAEYLRDVCRLLAERGHEIRVLCTEAADTPPYSIRTDHDGPVRVDRINLPYLRSQDPGGWMLNVRSWREHENRTLAAVTELVAEWEPDLVQFHTPHAVLEECLPLLLERSAPIVGMTHCAWTICPRLGLIRSPTGSLCEGPAPLRCLMCLYSHWDGTLFKAQVKLPWRVMKLGVYPAFRLRRRNRTRAKTQGMITVSKFMADVHQGRVGGPVQHIAMGINLEGLPSERPLRPRFPVRIGFAGGFQEHKGIWDVLDAASTLKKSGLKFELHIWGPHQDPGPVRDRNLDGTVVLRGLFDHSQRWSAFQEMDVHLMATRVAEAFGRVVQEAAAVGAPSIAPAVGGITEQIRDGVDGLLYKFRDRLDLEEKMTRVIEEPGLVSKLSSNLWTVIDTRDAVAGIEAFYFDILDKVANAEGTIRGR